MVTREANRFFSTDMTEGVMTELSQKGASWMVDATPETFAAEVFDRSQELPVVVDFWAEWC